MRDTEQTSSLPTAEETYTEYWEHVRDYGIESASIWLWDNTQGIVNKDLLAEVGKRYGY